MEIEKILNNTIEQGKEALDVNKRISDTLLKILGKLDSICERLKK